MTCENTLHNLYPDHCPECDPEAYELLMRQAPEGKIEPVTPPVVRRPVRPGDGYSDRY